MDPASFAIMMDTISQVVGIASAVVLMGLLILGVVWVVKIRTGSHLSKGDVAVLQDVNAKLRVMEHRMASLEKILDAEVPAWRVEFEEIGESHGRKMG